MNAYLMGYMGKEALDTGDEMVVGAGHADQFIPSRISANQLKLGFNAATKGGYDFTAGPGVFQPERDAAVKFGKTFVDKLNRKGVPIFRGRVKSPESIVKSVAAGVRRAGELPHDLLGLQLYAKDPKKYAGILENLRRQGMDIKKVSLFNNPAYRGINVSGSALSGKMRIPVEVQISPNKFANAMQIAMHDAGGYTQAKNLKGTKKGDVALMRLINKFRLPNQWWDNAPAGRLKITGSKGQWSNPFAAVKTGGYPSIVKPGPTTWHQPLKTFQGASGILGKAVPYFYAANVAAGALDPGTATSNFSNNMRNVKERSFLPGWTNAKPSDPSKMFGASEESWDAYNRNLADSSLAGVAATKAGDAWNSFHLGKPGALLNTALSIPGAVSGAVAKPVWDSWEHGQHQKMRGADPHTMEALKRDREYQKEQQEKYAPANLWRPGQTLPEWLRETPVTPEDRTPTTVARM